MCSSLSARFRRRTRRRPPRSLVVILARQLSQLRLGAISAQQLSLAYASDKTAADQQYTGQDVTVTGVFQDGGKNPNGPGSGFSIYDGTDGHYHLIQCYGDQNDLIAQLSMGDAIVVRGHLQTYELLTVLMIPYGSKMAADAQYQGKMLNEA